MDDFQQKMITEIKTTFERVQKLCTILVSYTEERNTQTNQSEFITSNDFQEISKLGKLRLRPNGTYELRYRKNGHQKSFYAKTATEATNKFNQWWEQSKGQHKQIQHKHKITFKEWFEEYLELYKVNKIADKSLSNILGAVRLHLYPILQDMELSQITQKDIQKCFNEMKAGHNSQKKLKYYTNSIFNLALKNKLIKENPVFDIKIIPPKQVRSEFLTAEEIQTLENLDKTNITNKFFIFCLYTGVRLSEALRFQISDINQSEKTILIRGTKTTNSLRTIPLFPNVQKLFPEDKVFKNEIFAELNATTLLKHFQKILPNRCIKDLRTTFATICHEKDIPAKVVQKWLGHSKIEMTLNVYTKVRKDFEFDQAKKMI